MNRAFYFAKKIAWLLLAITEAVYAFLLARNSVSTALKVVMTAIVRFKSVFQPNEAYFIGMFCGCLIWIIPAGILIFHATWITYRKILPKTASLTNYSLCRQLFKS